MKYFGLDFRTGLAFSLIADRENIAKEESLWRMAFSFAEGIYPMDLALSLLRIVSLRKDEPLFIVEKIIVLEYANCLLPDSFCCVG